MANEQTYQDKRQNMPDEVCDICAGTGYRKEPPHIGVGYKPCNGCDETGKVRPSITYYPFDLENVRGFVAFLENCGGFEIT